MRRVGDTLTVRRGEVELDRRTLKDGELEQVRLGVLLQDARAIVTLDIEGTVDAEGL